MAVPASPTVAFVDNADGTGAVATVDGDAGVTNEVFTLRVNETFGTNLWISGGSRSGDGTVSLSLAVGHYFGYAKSSNVDGAAVSTPAYFAVTSGNESIHYRCLEAAKARVILAGLDAMPAASVVTYHLPIVRDFFAEFGETALKTAPGVLITPYGTERHDPEAGTNFRDDIEYPCLITIFAVQNQALASNLDARLKWREQIFAAFRNQRLPGVDEVDRCTIEPGPIVDVASFDNNLWHSSMVLYCQARQRRGLGL